MSTCSTSEKIRQDLNFSKKISLDSTLSSLKDNVMIPCKDKIKSLVTNLFFLIVASLGLTYWAIDPCVKNCLILYSQNLLSLFGLSFPFFSTTVFPAIALFGEIICLINSAYGAITNYIDLKERLSCLD
jgi:hypothetical protein